MLGKSNGQSFGLIELLCSRENSFGKILSCLFNWLNCLATCMMAVVVVVCYSKNDYSINYILYNNNSI